MTILDPGHKFRLVHLDGAGYEELTFVKREGDKYPGNVGSYEGTNIQEVLRVLVSRVKYVDNQISCYENKEVIEHLRKALLLLEQRAAYRHGRILRITSFALEELPVCIVCGHLGDGHKCQNPKQS